MKEGTRDSPSRPSRAASSRTRRGASAENAQPSSDPAFPLLK
ncbi:MAG: hypothetical protein OEW45_06095 [Deltaproteobacteria bacterium]|nr:hypothetical protein [Deltaproteobacteria bacterium]